MDAKVKKLENEIKEAFLVEKLRMVRKGAYDHTNKCENYLRELISLLPWLRPCLTKRSDQGSALQIIECAMPTITMGGGDSP